MLSMIFFRDIDYTDRDLVQQYTLLSECRNCDFNFMNLMSWRFLYNTQIAQHRGMLIIRFLFDGKPAYLPPLTPPPYVEETMREEYAAVLLDLVAEAEAERQPFLMMGACQGMLGRLQSVLPGKFQATADRAFTDYIYDRTALETLAGKKLQSKRNHANRFEREYPHYEYRELTPDLAKECWKLEEEWAAKHTDMHARLDADDEQHSMRRVFKHWDELQARGAAILVDGRVVAFTFGGPINYDTFDVCCEKANTDYEGAYAIINRDFVRHLPEQYTLINREEDLGLEGLRRAKLSYQPKILLDKYTITCS